MSKLEDPYAKVIESMKWKVWHGNSVEGIEKLNKIYVELLHTDCADTTHDLLKCLSNNKEYFIIIRTKKS